MHDRVKPVRTYRIPRYPSYEDPDPTLHPCPVPFPFRRELLKAAAGVGVAAALGCGEPPKPGFANPTNPFLLARSGLPHQTSPYGTGAPIRIDDERAREVIDRVFRDEGFTLERGVSYDRDGVRFRLTGFDRRRRIGYVFGDYRNLDEDAVERWEILERDPNPRGDPAAIREWLRELERIAPSMPERIRAEVARVLGMEDGEAMVLAFDKLRESWHAELLSMEEMRRLEERAAKEKEFVAVISGFDERLETGHHLGDRVPASVVRERLELLERNVREYIAWARAQGLQ